MKSSTSSQQNTGSSDDENGLLGAGSGRPENMTPEQYAHARKGMERRARRAAEAAAAEMAQLKTDEHFMSAALLQAERAAAIGEVPIGCVIVKDGKILSRAYNRRNHDHSALSHAEVSSIRKACHKLGDWRLDGCTLYVTLEPCPMCAGACVQSRISRVVIGAESPGSGCGGSLLNILQNPGFNHRCEVTSGVLKKQCSAVLQTFFRQLREQKTE